MSIAAKVINDQIIAAMEKGVVPWKKPWNSDGRGPRNFISQKAYSGANVWLLTLANAYERQEWLTYNQAKNLGAQVKEGEHGTKIVFWTFIENKSDAKKKIPFLKYYTVFNVEQIEGLVLPELEEYVPPTITESLARAAAMWESYRDNKGPALSHGGARAAYSPAFDSIKMPLQGDFDSLESYYRTLFHECGHSTGAKARLCREGIIKPTGFGSELYSKEELVAEICSAYLSFEAGIGVDTKSSAAYINAWMKEIKTDPTLFVSAAGKAEKAANFFLGKSVAEIEETA